MIIVNVARLRKRRPNRRWKRFGPDLSPQRHPSDGCGDLRATWRERAQDNLSAISLAVVFRRTDEDLTWKSNFDGTRNLVAAAKAHAPNARFIMAGTSNVYGLEGSRPGREDDLVNAKQAYPASKIAAEKELRASGLTWSVLCFAFVYGDADGHIESMPKLLAQGRINFHHATCMSMIHHRDIAGAVKLPLSGAFDGRIVNVADDASTSMFELFELVGSTMEPSAEALRNPWHLCGDNSLARRLGLYPQLRTVFHAAQENAL